MMRKRSPENGASLPRLLTIKDVARLTASQTGRTTPPPDAGSRTGQDPVNGFLAHRSRARTRLEHRTPTGLQ